MVLHTCTVHQQAAHARPSPAYVERPIIIITYRLLQYLPIRFYTSVCRERERGIGYRGMPRPCARRHAECSVPRSTAAHQANSVLGIASLLDGMPGKEQWFSCPPVHYYLSSMRLLGCTHHS